MPNPFMFFKIESMLSKYSLLFEMKFIFLPQILQFAFMDIFPSMEIFSKIKFIIYDACSMLTRIIIAPK